jgi:hypothetical protein
MWFLLELAGAMAPGSGIMYGLYRLVDTRYKASNTFLRTQSLRSEAHLEGARARLEAADRAAGVAEGTAREALASTREALEVARTIELVSGQVQNLSDYLVNRIDGPQAPGLPWGRALPRTDRPGIDRPKITGGQEEGGMWS